MVTREPSHTELPECNRALVVAAHPDDIESWCAGTLALLIRRGAEVYYLLCTRGDKGSDDPEATRDSVAHAREAEQREAAREMGVRAVEFLDYEDGCMEDTREFRERLVRTVRKIRPEVVFTHDPVHPYPEYTVHRDHRVAGRAVLDCVYPLARDRLSFPEHEREGLAVHKVREVWLFSSSRPDMWIDISGGFEAKLRARLAHASQTPNPDALRHSWRERARRIGAEFGMELAEAFKVIRLEA